MKPNYVKGKYEFDKLEDVGLWLFRIKCLAKGQAGRWLYSLAKSGAAGGQTMKFNIEMNCTPNNYFVVSDKAYNVGLLKGGIGGDCYSSDIAIALEFAREIDKLNKST